MDAIEQAKKNMISKPLAWARPLVSELENMEEHLAMKWVIELLKVFEAKPKSAQFAKWINDLEEIYEGKKIYTIDELETLSKKIFNAPPARTFYQSLISNAYSIEGTFLLGEYESYKTKIVRWAAGLNDFESKTSPIVETAYVIFKNIMQSKK